MAARVVDASALGALVFNEPEAVPVARELGEHTLTAPVLLWFELASVCLKKIQAHRARPSELTTALRLARQLPIRTADVDPVAVVDLARTTKLTTYDASYLWLARHLDAKLVTLDSKLRNAIRRV